MLFGIIQTELYFIFPIKRNFDSAVTSQCKINAIWHKLSQMIINFLYLEHVFLVFFENGVMFKIILCLKYWTYFQKQFNISIFFAKNWVSFPNNKQ